MDQPAWTRRTLHVFVPQWSMWPGTIAQSFSSGLSLVPSVPLPRSPTSASFRFLSIGVFLHHPELLPPAQNAHAQ